MPSRRSLTGDDEPRDDEEEKPKPRRTSPRKPKTEPDQAKLSSGLKRLGAILDRGVSMPSEDDTFGQVLIEDADKMAEQLIRLAKVAPPVKVAVAIITNALGPFDAFGRMVILMMRAFKARRDRLQAEWEAQQQEGEVIEEGGPEYP